MKAIPPLYFKSFTKKIAKFLYFLGETLFLVNFLPKDGIRLQDELDLLVFIKERCLFKTHIHILFSPFGYFFVKITLIAQFGLGLLLPRRRSQRLYSESVACIEEI